VYQDDSSDELSEALDDLLLPASDTEDIWQQENDDDDDEDDESEEEEEEDDDEQGGVEQVLLSGHPILTVLKWVFKTNT
jgi:hypothetical protein